MKQKRILCIGNAVLDQLYMMDSIPTTPGKYFAKSFLEAGGGPAATGSVAIARLGQYARLWSRIGDDPAGDRIIKELRGYGVDLTGLERIKGVISALAAIAVDARGERMILGFMDPNFPQGADWLPLDDIKTFDAVLADVRWQKGAAAVLTEAARLGIPSVLDADSSPSLEALQTLVPLAGHPIFSEPGLKQYTGDPNPESALRKVAASIKGIPYVTLGEKGCLWIEGGKLHSSPAFLVDAVDTTGAGDVFHGAFALALAEGKAGAQAVRFASGAAALKCTRPGGRAGIPDRASLEEFLKK